MALRTVYGNDFSENGWPMVDAGSCTWVTVPGTNVSIQIQDGQPLQIIRAWVADWNAVVEPVRDGDTCCWTPTNSVGTSNHLSGTAVDIDWNSHPFRVRGSLNDEQMRNLREMLEFYEDTVFWAGDWDDPPDEMHSQMGYGTYGPKNFERVQDFIRRKIRADGFSTFHRGDAPDVDLVAVLAEAMGNRAQVDYASKLPAVQQCLRECDCNTVERIAMWMAQVGTESGGLQWMEEIASGAEYEGRRDLGNTKPGDGCRYKGRGPIQVTGRHNYTNLSEWAFEQGLVPTPTFFVDDPGQLASDQYGFMGVTWYWTTQRPMNDASDARDIVLATKYVNGGTHGLDDRRARWVNCMQMGDQLLALTREGDDVPLIKSPSYSIYRDDDTPLPWEGTPLDFIIDGRGHENDVERLATFGEPVCLYLLNRTATGKSPVDVPDWQVNRAKQVWASVPAEQQKKLPATDPRLGTAAAK